MLWLAMGGGGGNPHTIGGGWTRDTGPYIYIHTCSWNILQGIAISGLVLRFPTWNTWDQPLTAEMRPLEFPLTWDVETAAADMFEVDTTPKKHGYLELFGSI